MYEGVSTALVTDGFLRQEGVRLQWSQISNKIRRRWMECPRTVTSILGRSKKKTAF